MNSLKDMPIAIAMPLLVPIKGFEDGRFLSYPDNFKYLESNLSSYNPTNSRTADNRMRSETNEKNESRIHPDRPKKFSSILKAIST